jgi:hypothetical protein
VSADKVVPQGDADKVGAGTVMSGLRPALLASMVPGGVVPSVNIDSVIVLEPGSVESMLLIEERVTAAAGSGLQNPDMFDVLNGDVIGNGATEGDGDVTGAGAGEGDEDVNPGIALVLELTTVVTGVVGTTIVASLVAELVIEVVGHMVIAPSEVPGIGPKVPRLSCTAPNWIPAVLTVGIVPGTVMDVAIDEVVGLAGAPRVVADPTCATADPPPIKITADIVSKRFINVSLIAVEPLSISD